MTDVSLTVETDERPSKSLLVGLSNPGLAGLTGSDYVIDRLDLDQTGHVSTDGVPPIAPFENGRPRHHTRLYSRDDLDVTVLTSELPIPLRATEAFGRDLLDWVLDNDVQEVTILQGFGSIGGADDGIYYVASADYQEHRLADAPFSPLAGGFLDGINASLVSRAIDTPLRVGILATPISSPRLDGDAALRLVEAADLLYGLGVETDSLRQFARETRQYFEHLAHRVSDQDTDRSWDQAFV